MNAPSNIDWRLNAQKNASIIEAEIESLNNGHWHMFNRKYKEFWEHSKTITDMFKTLKPLLKEDRERLWEHFRNICDQVKVNQDNERIKHQIASKTKRDLILMKIRNAYFYATGGKNQGDLTSAKALLSEALENMKAGDRMTKDDNDECWEKWREANEQLKYKREFLWEVDYNRLNGMALEAKSAATYDPHEAMKKIKSTQAEMKTAYMNKDQRGWVREILNEAYEIASSKFNEMRAEKERKHAEWLERMEGKISHWQGSIEKCESAISRLEAQISDLEYKESTARSDDFASMVRGWITEKYDKIRDIRNSISELEGKIASLLEKMRK